MSQQLSFLAFAVLAIALSLAAPARADSKDLIDANTARALAWLSSPDHGTADLLERAAGVLVFPDVVKMGFGVGGEFGEGSLVVQGKTVDYYATAGKTYGMEGSGYKAEVILFMTREALQAFRRNRSWEVEQEAVPILWGPADDMVDVASREPLVGLIFSEGGLVSHLRLDGDKITRIVR